MVLSRADAGNDPFADTGNDRRFTGTADEAVDVSTNRNPGPTFNSIPFWATAEIKGVSMTFGLTLI